MQRRHHAHPLAAAGTRGGRLRRRGGSHRPTALEGGAVRSVRHSCMLGCVVRRRELGRGGGVRQRRSSPHLRNSSRRSNPSRCCSTRR
jgi:hypothetical protein